MASTISVTGSTVISTNKVKAFVEAAYRLQAGEIALSVNPNHVTIAANDDTRQFTITASIPVTQSFDTNGNVITSAVDYTTTAITPGGDVKATNAAALLLEFAQKLVDAEDAKVAEPNSTFVPVTNLSINANSQRADISTVIPFTTALANGVPVMTAVDYL